MTPRDTDSAWPPPWLAESEARVADQADAIEPEPDAVPGPDPEPGPDPWAAFLSPDYEFVAGPEPLGTFLGHRTIDGGLCLASTEAARQHNAAVMNRPHAAGPGTRTAESGGAQR